MFKLLFNRLGVHRGFFNCIFRLQIGIKKNWGTNRKPTSVLTPGQIWHVAADRKTKERNEFYFIFLKERKKSMRQSGSKFPDSLQSMRSRTRCTVPFVANANFAGTGGGVGTLARERAGPH
jgi:hypothetical protein